MTHPTGRAGATSLVSGRSYAGRLSAPSDCFPLDCERRFCWLVEEEPYENIAEALGISVGAVKVRVFRGVRILRKQLSQAGVHS